MQQEPTLKTLLEPRRFAEEFEAAARQAGFRLEPFGEIAGFPLLAATRRTRGVRPRIYLSAGIHGDEPAGPHALLELVRRGTFDRRATWFICPLLNPIGFARRTRENAEGIDLNRDYRALRSLEIQAHARWLKHQPNFDLALCLHEDWESQGFYLYELNPGDRTSLAPEIIAAVENCCAIESAAIIDGRPISERAIIRPVSDPLLRDDWPEAIYLRAHHTRLSYTLESPSALALAQRVDAQVAAVQAAVDRLSATISTSRRGLAPARSTAS